MDANKFHWAVDWAVRLENPSDSAKGGAARRRGAGRWLILPAAGAGLYALATSRTFSRQARDVVDQAKTLPDDLMSRLRQTTEKTAEATTETKSSSGNGSRSRRQTRARRSTTRRKPAESR